MQPIADFLHTERTRDDDRYVLILLGPESEWKGLWSAVKVEQERAPFPKNPFAIIEDSQSWPWTGIGRTFYEYDALQKKLPFQNWFHDQIKEFRFPKRPKTIGGLPLPPFDLEMLRQDGFNAVTGFSFFLRKCVSTFMLSQIDTDFESSLSKDPPSVKAFAELLSNDTIITTGPDGNGTTRAKKDRVRKMTFVIGVQNPFITTIEEPTTGNPMLDLSRKKREDILKSLQNDLGAEVMQYVGKIIMHAK
jgi:hypothetical protein